MVEILVDSNHFIKVARVSMDHGMTRKDCCFNQVQKLFIMG
ncbi:protein of unknown function [Candidatus Nitrosotalea okcheonensis]|uniref:Uncharacterized protein n=1 Tax=Candidatus Nitrosotalea okcheonensis TaxID=1903276 RepID=A0A2H1FGD7_9ARCH|nr:protein of unknown function [Candidatus Nitrosotalea okcheonensis]